MLSLYQSPSTDRPGPGVSETLSFSVCKAANNDARRKQGKKKKKRRKETGVCVKGIKLNAEELGNSE